MKYLWLLFALIVSPPLVAESLGNLNYTVPHGWKLVNELNACKKTSSKTLVYAPESTTRANAKEFFSAHINNLPSPILDHDTLKMMLEIQFPKQNVSVNVLDQTPDSILYEWIVKDEERERLHGWARMFATKQGTAILSYQTEKIDQAPNVKNQWLETFKEAKIN